MPISVSSPAASRHQSRHLARSSALALALAGLATAPLNAESADMTAGTSKRVDATIYVPGTSLARFAPAADRDDHTIDYSYLDEALTWMVIPMGPSIRQGARRVEPLTGTRFVYGHNSRFRMEGNRVAFSFLTPDIKAGLTEYRRDLERVGSSLDITRIPRNEQLAFWFNLHNVAVIEALASQYPVSQTVDAKFGPDEAPLDDAKLVTIGGVELSPRDIRERIVYPNWKDPKVIYGFWRGEIGGPSIQRTAFTGGNVSFLLSLSGEEFVNSLRGVEKYSGALQVSEIYREAAPFYFEDDAALRAHLRQYAGEAVSNLLKKTDETRYNRYERDVADLSHGQRDPALLNLLRAGDATEAGGLFGIDFVNGLGAAPVSSRPDVAVQRFMQERSEKLNRAWRRGIRTGQVIVGDGDLDEVGKPKEVE
ncbi:MAG: DUF547 domain-containing protein [Erythrobacter sp.]